VQLDHLFSGIYEMGCDDLEISSCANLGFEKRILLSGREALKPKASPSPYSELSCNITCRFSA